MSFAPDNDMKDESAPDLNALRFKLGPIRLKSSVLPLDQEHCAVFHLEVRQSPGGISWHWDLYMI